MKKLTPREREKLQAIINKRSSEQTKGDIYIDGNCSKAKLLFGEAIMIAIVMLITYIVCLTIETPVEGYQSFISDLDLKIERLFDYQRIIAAFAAIGIAIIIIGAIADRFADHPWSVIATLILPALSADIDSYLSPIRNRANVLWGVIVSVAFRVGTTAFISILILSAPYVLYIRKGPLLLVMMLIIGIIQVFRAVRSIFSVYKSDGTNFVVLIAVVPMLINFWVLYFFPGLCYKI